MELEEMKSIWSDLSDQLEKQKKLTNKTILKMTQEQYNNSIAKIIFPEKIGAIICFLAAGYIILNINKLDTPLSLGFGIATALILIILPLFSLRTMKTMSESINIAENSYKQTLIDFAKIKIKFNRFKKFSYFLGITLLIFILPPFAKIAKGIDVFSDIKYWYKVPFGVVLFSVMVYFIMRYYSKNIGAVDTLLKDLNDDD